MIARFIKTFCKTIYFNLFISYFLVFFIIIIIIALFSYNFMFHTLEDKSNDYYHLMIQSINNNIEKYISELSEISFILYKNDIHLLLNEINDISDRNSWEYSYKKGLFLSPFQTWKGSINLNKGLKSIIIMNSSGGYYIREGLQPTMSGRKLLSTEFYTEVINKHGKIAMTLIDGSQWFYTNDSIQQQQYLLAARKIINIGGLSSDLGIIMLIVSMEDIQRDIESITKNITGNFFIVDGNNTIILSSNRSKNDLFEGLHDINGDSQTISYQGNDYLVNQYKSNSTGWKFITVSSIHEINNELSNLKMMTFGFVIAALVIAVFISILFSRTITKPISKLKTFASQVEKGVLDSGIHLNSYQEFNILAKAFNTMIAELKEIINNNYILTIRSQEAELKALQAQINPHFLYNTLNSINAYAQIHEIIEISNMTYALSSIFRYNIRNMNELVTIREEIDHIKNYMEIQNIRYSNTISVIYNIEEGILECKTVRLILQPMVENSLLHGLENKKGLKEITITGFTHEDNIIFNIIDNGVGMSDEKLNALNEYLQSPAYGSIKQKGSKFNIGIDNVNQRIKLILGYEYGLKITSCVGTGTTFIITLPRI